MSETRPSRLRRLLRRAGIATGLIGLVLLAATGGGILWVRAQLSGSLALLDGERTLPELARPVSVERDDMGIPTIRGSSRSDVARATGFVHAQERFFQMDLLRRSAAGELAELVGPAVLSSDRSVRVHRFRHLSEVGLEHSSNEGRAILAAYTEGVNAGLAALDAPPPAYLALRAEPRPWRPEDSLLAVRAMYLDLQGSHHRRESTLGLMQDRMPAELVAFLAPQGTEWDAPIEGPALLGPPVPGPEIFDLRSRATAGVSGPRPTTDLRSSLGSAIRLGSNSWAVAGTQAADGGALLANDMHLGLSLPNIWYRASLAWPDGAGGLHVVTGATLPGAPTIVVGSNGHIAWGFTNSEIDVSDLIVLDIDPEDKTLYLTPDGLQEIERVSETIVVNGAEDAVLDVGWTRWGPIVDQDHLGRPRVLRWVAHDRQSVNLGLLGMETARDLEQALEAAARTGIPTQNCLVADRTGRIGWTLMGPVPQRRAGFSGRWPGSWADGSRGWDGYLEPDAQPQVVDPTEGRLWTANNRVVGGAMLALLGDAGFAGGARAQQIRDGLRAIENATPESMLAVQLDDRALFLDRWRHLLLDVLSLEAVADHSGRVELRQAVEHDWSGRASIDSAGYRMVRAFRLYLAEETFDAISRTCLDVDEDFNLMWTGQWEGPLWSLLEERPPHLASPAHADWEAQLLAAADRVVERFFSEAPGSSPPQRSALLHALLRGLLGRPPDAAQVETEPRSWGERNTVRVRHPLSLGVGALAPWFDIAAQPLPGDGSMPRVQSSRAGASQRMGVSPGREDDGYFHMPGGQSGHPLSPFYRKGHEAWAEGRPLPFLPGPTVHRLSLVPGSG